MSGESKLEIKIPDDLIETTILSELAKQMPNKQAMIEEVIRVALTEKAERYSNETKFQATMKKMIHEAAGGIFEEWVEQNKEAIRDALLKALTRSKAKQLKSIVDGLVSGMGKWSTRVTIDLKDE